MTQNEYIFPFEKLEIWQMSVDLAKFIIDLLRKVPINRHLRLVGQMEAASVSVSQNIAEGKGRQYKKEFLQYLSIAQGSLYEVVTLNEIFSKTELFTESECFEIRKKATAIDRKLNGLMNALRGKRRISG